MLSLAGCLGQISTVVACAFGVSSWMSWQHDLQVMFLSSLALSPSLSSRSSSTHKAKTKTKSKFYVRFSATVWGGGFHIWQPDKKW